MPENENSMAEQQIRRLQSLTIDRQPGKGQNHYWRPLVVVLLLLNLLLAAGFIIFFYYESHLANSRQVTSAETSTTIQPQPTATKTLDAVSQWVVAGYLVAQRQTVIGADVTARIAEILVEEGDIVTKGQLIARLDSQLAESDLAIARSQAGAADAAVNAIAAELAEAERSLRRTEKLAQQQLASSAELENTAAQQNILCARLAEAQAQRATAYLEAERAELVVARHRLYAPFAGAIAGCMMQPGEIFSPTNQSGAHRVGICTIIDTASIEIELDVNETFISRVTPGNSAVAVVDAYPDSPIPSQVRAILPSANREKSTVKVRLSMAAIPHYFRPEMSVKVRFEQQAENQTRVSRTPLHYAKQAGL